MHGRRLFFEGRSHIPAYDTCSDRSAFQNIAHQARAVGGDVGDVPRRNDDAVIVGHPFLYGAEAHLMLDVVHDTRTRQKGSEQDDAQAVVRRVGCVTFAEVRDYGCFSRFGIEKGRILGSRYVVAGQFFRPVGSGNPSAVGTYWCIRR